MDADDHADEVDADHVEMSVHVPLPFHASSPVHVSPPVPISAVLPVLVLAVASSLSQSPSGISR